MTHPNRIAPILALAAFLAGCSEDLEPRTQITELRILAVKAEPPAALPGQEVQLSALVVNPLDEPVTYAWYACAIPEAMREDDIIGFGCTDTSNPDVWSLGTGETATLTVPSDYLERTDVLEGQYGASDLPEEAIAALQAIGGVHLRVVLVLRSPSKRIDIFKRLIVTSIPDANDNPEPPVVVLTRREDFADVPLTADAPGDASCLATSDTLGSAVPGEWAMTPVNQPDPPAQYPVIDFMGGLQVRDERYVFAWFSTADVWDLAFTKAATPENFMNLNNVPDDALEELPDGGRALPYWIVSRDRRGGVNWCRGLLPFDAE